MRRRFDEQLLHLNHSLIAMAALVENAIARATTALVERDVAAAKEIMKGDNEINEKEKEIESLCLKLLLNQHPVAKDLRQVSTALKMITDMERIGDHAADISELILYFAQEPYIKKLDHIPQMASVTSKMLTDSINAFVQKDVELAREVIARDDIVDELFMAVRRDLITLVHKDVNNGEQAFDLLQIAKYYERIGDHAVNLAEWVIFSITGKHKNTQIL